MPEYEYNFYDARKLQRHFCCCSFAFKKFNLEITGNIAEDTFKTFLDLQKEFSERVQPQGGKSMKYEMMK